MEKTEAKKAMDVLLEQEHTLRFERFSATEAFELGSATVA